MGLRTSFLLQTFFKYLERVPVSTRRFVLAPLALSACIALVACSQPAETGVSSSETNTSEARSVAAEVTNPQARLVATYDGGITVLDAETLEEVTDIPLDGFNRLNPLGDQRTVAVSTDRKSTRLNSSH